jgi:DNA-binding LytR/AlgR family response regulator
LPQSPDVDPPDDLLDHWDLQGGPLAVVAEMLQVGPVYMATWLLLNLRPIVTLRAPTATASATDSATESPAASFEPESKAWLATLPPLIGQDVISVSSDLHYLHVTTARGRITVLGNLAAVEQELAAVGSRVHRSHWVADRHIRRIARSARGWTCELSDGRRVPISRRRAGEIRAKLGSDFVVTRLD